MPNTSTEQTREHEALAGNEGFQDMVVRAAEEMVLHAPLDDLITFAYGTWDDARAAWQQEQRTRFRRTRPGKEAQR